MRRLASAAPQESPPSPARGRHRRRHRVGAVALLSRRRPVLVDVRGGLFVRRPRLGQKPPFHRHFRTNDCPKTRSHTQSRVFQGRGFRSEHGVMSSFGHPILPRRTLKTLIKSTILAAKSNGTATPLILLMNFSTQPRDRHCGSACPRSPPCTTSPLRTFGGP
jgi:hypothetical protein